jgi:hypothetical protein
VPTAWKQVRVFISSTFRDMHAERDYLVKACFPRLRQWCEERRLHLVDVDLRWGITREEAENGKALELCLQEIEGCRPFFLCLIGEQYGSVAPAASAAVAGADPTAPYSITHLEILRAALEAQPQGTGVEPFFYFRDPSALPAPQQLDASTEERQAYAAAYFQAPPAPGAPDLQERLAQLKQRIRQAFGPAGRVHEYGGRRDPAARNPRRAASSGHLVGLEALGEQVEADLRCCIESNYREHLEDVREPQDAAQQDRTDRTPLSRTGWHGDAGGTLGCWEYLLPDGRRRREAPGSAAAFSPDGTVCASVHHYDGRSSSLRVFDATTFEERCSIPSAEGHVEVVCFSPAADRLVHTDGYAIVVREWPSTRELLRLRGHQSGVKQLLISDDGLWLTSACVHRVRVWALATGECSRCYDGRTDFMRLSQAPLGDQLWPIAAEGELRVVRAATGEAVAFAPGAWQQVRADPQGQRFVATMQSHLQGWELTTLGASWPSSLPPVAAEAHRGELKGSSPAASDASVWRQLRRAAARVWRLYCY